MTKEQLTSILENHAKWLSCREGVRTDLSRAYLYRANLNGADLCGANLRGADLRGAYLYGADLRGSDLHGADLRGSDLRGSDLYRANLCEANLIGADLSRANLIGTDLIGTNLYNSILHGTVLDPDSVANGDVEQFEVSTSGMVIGYRTRRTGHTNMYRNGWVYSADWFSTCTFTECHPGLYLWPTLDMALGWSSGEEIIRVEAPAEHVHHVGSKWRCRWFRVLGSATP